MCGNTCARRLVNDGHDMASSRFIPIMRCLAENGAQSSARLAQRLKLSPSAVRRALSVLRGTYGAVEYHQPTWQLTFSPQWLCVETLSAALPECKVVVVEETPGTNMLAKTGAGKSVFFAEHQTQGRGRYGRRWLAVPGGAVMLSLRLPAPASLSGLSLAVGTALCQSLSPGLRLKWPNDLLNARGEKVGGILIETAGDDVIVGAGINLIMTARLREHVARPMSAIDIPRMTCAVSAVQTLYRAVEVFTRGGLSSFLPDAMEAHYYRAGSEMEFRHADGIARGRFAGFAEDGALLMECGGVRRFVSGEIAHVVGG